MNELSLREEFEITLKQCKSFVLSGLLPDSITKGVTSEVAIAKALTIVYKGKELGLPPLYSLSSINIIKGKPCLSAELMLALIYKKYPDAKIEFITPIESADKECEVLFSRPNGSPQKFRFTIKDAERAGLLSNPNSSWVKYPQAMLRARAISMGARAVFPDAIMGCYTPEEITSIEETKEEEKSQNEKIDDSSIDKIIEAFAALNIGKDRLEEFLKKPLNELTKEEIEKLRLLYKDLLTGSEKGAPFFS